MSNDVYTPENVPLFEAMYGPGLISLGGYEAIDQMVKDVGIKAKHLLDVGSGIGEWLIIWPKNTVPMSPALKSIPGWLTMPPNTRLRA